MADDDDYVNSSYRISMKFLTADGQRTYSFSHAKKDLDFYAVNHAMDVMIENGNMFQTPPLTKVEASIIKVTTTPVVITE